MQCMWWEIETGKSYHRQNNLRSSLKNFNFIERHFEQFVEDQFDFHVYAFRKFVLLNYIQMIDFEDHLYNNKFARKAALGMIKTLKTMTKVGGDELKKVEKEKGEFEKTTEYKELQRKLQEKDEDDDYKVDPDPQGFDLYKTALADPYKKALQFGGMVAKHNPECAALQAAMIPVYLNKSKYSAD